MNQFTNQDHAAFARRISRQLPSARLVLVKGCDHSVPNEQEARWAAKFAQALDDNLNSSG
jgi:pimeloyl-ACP methyl ester carboxylesterase